MLLNLKTFDRFILKWSLLSSPYALFSRLMDVVFTPSAVNTSNCDLDMRHFGNRKVIAGDESSKCRSETCFGWNVGVLNLARPLLWLVHQNSSWDTQSVYLLFYLQLLAPVGRACRSYKHFFIPSLRVCPPLSSF